MNVEVTNNHLDNFDLVRRGFAHRIGRQLGLGGGTPARRMLKILVLLALTWLPLAFLSLIAGHAIGGNVAVPFFHDPEVHARLLFVLPLLELAEVIVGLSLSMQARHLLEMGVIVPEDRPRCQTAQRDAVRFCESTNVDIVILILAYILAVLLRLVVGFSDGSSSWERAGSAVTVAGWWHMLVSLPILYFFLLRWLMVFGVWSHFLYQVSRLKFNLTATHPDRTGGLGFLGWGLACFSTVLMAISAVFSAGFAAEILHHGESLNSLKYHVITFAVIAIVIVHAPLLSFSGQLARCRFLGLLEFGALVWRYDREFDEKWLETHPNPNQESILGSSDVQSMADIATCYEHVNEMWLIPFDMKAFTVLAISTLLPMVPLLGTEVPLQEIIMKLGELLV